MSRPSTSRTCTSAAAARAAPTFQSIEVQEELKAHVRSALAPYKAPRVAQFVDGLPKRGRGKVLKSALQG